jgi:hypothetical protein
VTVLLLRGCRSDRDRRTELPGGHAQQLAAGAGALPLRAKDQ